jgi:subtilisin family serine protease
MDPELWELYEAGDGEDEVAAIIRLSQPAAVPPGVRIIAQFDNIVTVRMPRGAILAVRQDAEVETFKAAGPPMGAEVELDDTDLLEGWDESVQPSDERRPPLLDATGRGVVVGCVDWGLDFAHPDFRNPDGSTRILALWDQRDKPGPASPQPYGYGIVHTREAIDRALAADDPYAALGYHSADADMGRGAHGTLVASVAAGNGRGGGPVGIAPEAELVFVHNATWRQDPSDNLGDSVTLLEAIDFIIRTAGGRPCVINLSMGRTGEQHDGTTPVEQALDAALRAAPGCVICQSAGNYFTRRLHASGQLRPAEERSLTWVTLKADVTPNELEIWYPGRDKLEIDIRSPDGSVAVRLKLGERAPLVAGGQTIGRAYHRAMEPNTLDNHVDIFLYRGAPAGDWEVTLIATDVVDGRFHAWIERDSCPDCQSHFRHEDADPTSTTGTICNGLRTIAVGAYNPHRPDQPVAPFSSMGPTRDSRIKPDLCAPGVGILGARSAPRAANGQAPLLTRMSGTSFAAPHVTGCVALMLQVAPRSLRIEEVHNLLLASTRRVSFPEELPGRVGSGYLDIERAVAAARNIGGIGPKAKPPRAVKEEAMNHEDQELALEFLEDAYLESEAEDEAEAEKALVEIGQEFDAREVEMERAQADAWEDGTEQEELLAELQGPFLNPVGYINPSSYYQVSVYPLTHTPAFTSTGLDEALQFALRQRATNSYITGNLLTGTQYQVFRCDFSGLPLPTTVMEFEATQPIAALVLWGDLVYLPSNPLKTTTRWVQLNRPREFYALAERDRNGQRRRWVDKINQARASITIPGVTVDRDWLNSRSMPELRSLLAFFASSIFAILNVNQNDPAHHKQYLGGEIKGVTLPVCRVPISEPDCYLPAVASREVMIEAINAYDLGAGVSLGPTQFNAIEGFLFQFLARVSDSDSFLFNQAFGSRNWSIRADGGHPDLVIHAGAANETVLHGAADDTNVHRNVGYLQSGTPGHNAFGQIDAAFRRSLTGAFRTLVVWPHIQEFILEIAATAELAPGLQIIHHPDNHIPPLDPSNPDRDTYILKTLLLSAYVRFNACLRPFLRALRHWNNPADKLRHWQDALNDESISWGVCNRSRRDNLIRRLNEQEPEARRIYAAIRRAMSETAAESWVPDTPENSEWTEIYEMGEGLVEYQPFDLNEQESDCDCGTRLVELADAAIADRTIFPGAGGMLEHVLNNAGSHGALITTDGKGRRVSPTEIFDGFVYPGREALRSHWEQYFEIVALPRTRLINELQPGDLLVRRGDGGFGHVAMLATGETFTQVELAALGIKPESSRSGRYAVVIEGGTFPHCSTHGFARRLSDANDWLGHDTLILRIAGTGRPSTSFEMAAFEYDAEDLGSATEDYSLQQIADGTLGRLPDDILAAILTTGESDANDLTNRVFWQNHPALSGQSLDPKDPKQQALRQEWGRILHRQVKPIIWLRQVIDQLDRYRGDLPREFLLGWMAVESDGKVATVSTLEERGYFQIMWQGGEAKAQLGLTSDEFRRLSTDREFSIEKGVQLAQAYRQHFLRKYPTVLDGSDLLWRLTKGRHALPGALDQVLDRLVKAGAVITWQAVSQSLPKLARGVNRTLDYAAKLKPLADRVPAAPAAPEFYSGPAPWLPGREILPFEPGLLQEQPQNTPKCGFHGPNGAFVAGADLRQAVADAALNERKIWWTGNTAQKEDDDARFGDLVRYSLAGQSSKIPPDKLEVVQQAAGAGDRSIFSNLSNATLGAAVQAYRAESKKFDDKTADVYRKSDLVDLSKMMVSAAETRFKAAETKVSLVTANLKNAGSQSGSGAQAALAAASKALSEAKAERDTAQGELKNAKQALSRAERDLAKAHKSYKDAKKALEDLEDPVEKWTDADIRKTRKAILDKAGSKAPNNLDVPIQNALEFAYQSRADSRAWSAVFVVSCVRAAAIGLKLEAIDSSGAHGGRDGLLKASPRHADYVVEAREHKRNRVGGTYHAFKPTERAVQVGDIICTDRRSFIGTAVRLEVLPSRFLLHGDIVTFVKTENGKQVYAETIGGNVRHTVRRRRYPLDEQGKLIVSPTVLYETEDDQGVFQSVAPLTQAPSMLKPHSTSRIIALLSLVEECNTPSGVAPTNKSAKEAYADFEPGILEAQAANVVDEDAAEPIFTGPVRQPSAPLPDATALKKASQWNQKMHPKESGISLAELRARLEQYIDRPALNDLVRQANAGAPPPPYGSDEATIVTLLAEQFQRKTCRMPTVGEIWQPPTMDGRVAEDTLDALGFVYHLGKKTDLNLADHVNTTAADTLKKVKASEFEGLEPGLTANTWWTYMVRPPWLGMPIKHGIHLVLLKRLRQAQRFLMDLHAYENMSPAELGKVLGLGEEHKGARPGTATKSMHTFGLGIDIGHSHNPWLSNPERNTDKVPRITSRAAQFIGGKPKNQKGISAEFLHRLAVDHQDTAEIYQILSEWSNWLGSYFALANDPKRVESMLPILNATNPDIGFIRVGDSLTNAARRWIGIIKSDFADFATAVSYHGNKEWVRHGFLTLPRDLVLALREYACLGWGAVDFGPSESGDIMHFDCRVDGIGRAIRKATGKAAPTEGHRCIPTAERKSNSGEFAEDTPKQTPQPAPQPLRFRFKSTTIPRYKDVYGDLSSTDCSIFVPNTLRNQKQIDVLVFFPGLDSCDPHYCFDPDLVIKNFRLDVQVDNGQRKVALAAPVVYWNKESLADIRTAWSAANLNAFVEEVLVQIGNQSGVPRSLGELFLVGHSKAYEILTPLANEFIKSKGAGDTAKGALAKLTKVCALDTTYSENVALVLRQWASNLKAVQFNLVLSGTKDPDCKFEKKGYPPIKYWVCAMDGKTLPKNLDVKKVSEGHCEIPMKYLNELLKIKP